MILRIRSRDGTDRITVPDPAAATVGDLQRLIAARVTVPVPLQRLSLDPALLLPPPPPPPCSPTRPPRSPPSASPMAPSSTSPTRPTPAPPSRLPQSPLRRRLLRQEDDHGRPHRAPDPRHPPGGPALRRRLLRPRLRQRLPAPRRRVARLRYQARRLPLRPRRRRHQGGLRRFHLRAAAGRHRGRCPAHAGRAGGGPRRRHRPRPRDAPRRPGVHAGSREEDQRHWRVHHVQPRGASGHRAAGGGRDPGVGHRHSQARGGG
ncbi:hypothetical protein EE612_002734 [Oryza sativa]|nr:hypothetical protein EE612_002734 [Oryza sativa]KAB8081494.1 hypothetical protein EE612_002734 [Oryza sativa]